MKVGRPTTYTQELADEICSDITLGCSIRTVCSKETMPSVKTFYTWLRTHDEFLQQYTRATEERSEAMAEDIMDIADDGSNDWMVINRKDGTDAWQLNGEHVQRSRLRVESRKWLMAKMKPKKYGDKLDVVSEGEKLQLGNIIGYVLPSINNDK